MSNEQAEKLIKMAFSLNETKQALLEAADTIQVLSDKLDARENIVFEFCSECETEIGIAWDVKAMGYKAFCPVCGKRLMLCDECQHAGKDGEYTGGCDYREETDSCKHNLTKSEQYCGGGWIPCNERLPKKDGLYMATLDGKIIGKDKPFSSIACFENGKWLIFDEDDHEEVLAWMENPDPYKPDGGGGGMSENKTGYTTTANLGRVEIPENVQPYIRELLLIRKELEQYRSIGTPEQFASYKAMFDDEIYRDRMIEAIGRKMTDELSEYKSIGAPDECRLAVEKQNLKKAIHHKAKGGFCGFYQCPSCKWKIEIDEWYRHCPNCGQHIYIERDAE